MLEYCLYQQQKSEILWLMNLAQLSLDMLVVLLLVWIVGVAVKHYNVIFYDHIRLDALIW